MCKIGAFQHAILNLYDLNLWALDKKADILGLDSDFLLFALLVALLVQTNEAGVEYAELSREKLLSYCLNAFHPLTFTQVHQVLLVVIM